MGVDHFPDNDFPDKPVNLYKLYRKLHFKNIQFLLITKAGRGQLTE